MNDEAPRVPRDLEVGILGVGGIAGCELGGPAAFDPAERRWVLTVQLLRADAAEFIPRRTEWKVLVDPEYPLGRIAFYPSAAGSITATFQHQDRNVRGPDGRQWRDGKLCLDSPFRDTLHNTSARDPVGDADGRLRWYVERAIAWLNAAAAGTLVAGGEPFELPQRPVKRSDPQSSIRIVHDESSATFAAWDGRSGIGPARLRPITGIGSAVAVAEFSDDSGNLIRKWGGRPSSESPEGALDAFWWFWPAPIVIKPWHTPSTWGELRRVGKANGVDVDGILRQLARRRRGSTDPTVLLLGYAIPGRMGEEPTEVHWDAVLLPKFEKGAAPSGFRANENGWWVRDRQRGVLADSSALVHLETENWSSSRLLARGGISESVRGKRIAIIGLGALGSAIAELLARVGIGRFLLIDGDLLSAGNICRHVATLADVGRGKVDVVASRLLQISPHAIVDKHGRRLPNVVTDLEKLLDACDVVLDCTASDQALTALARGWWAVPRLFFSASVGHSAQRLFAFTSFGSQFPVAEFQEQLRPWLRKETGMWASSGEVLEGAGCWSPVSPARYDDLMLSAATCVRILESTLAAPDAAAVLRVFERDAMGWSCHSSAANEAPHSSEELRHGA